MSDKDYFKKYVLSEVLEKVIDYRGKTPKKLGKEWSDRGYRALSANNIKFEGLTRLNSINYGDEELYRLWMKEEVKKGDILLTSEAPSGQALVWDSDEKIILSQRLFALRIDTNVVDNYYLKYYIQSENGQRSILSNNSGSTVFGISAKTFNNIKLLLPDLKIQKQIGYLLKCIDQKIMTNQAIIDNLENMAKTLYDYWFIQFDFPDKNGKPYKTSGGAMVYNDSLKRPIPEGWEVRNLKNQLNIERGISYTSENIKNNIGTPMINLASVDINKNYKPDGIKMYEGNVSSEKKLKKGDLVIACTDVTQNGEIIGCPIAVPFTEGIYTFSTDLVKIEPIYADIDKYYLLMSLRTEEYHNFIKPWASGTTVLHLNLSGIDWYNIVLPPLDIQQKYARFVINKLAQEGRVIEENKNLTQLRDFLLPLLMNGQVTVSS